jgi:DNA adenine methylase
MRNERDYFYTRRERFNQIIREGRADSKEAASLFYYLNRTCYNGLCRFNSKGEFNVPFGSYRKIIYKTDFSEYVHAFAQWEFVCADFEKVGLTSDDFVYADPPYDVEFTQYSKEVFGWDEQVRLAEWLARHPGPVVLSNQATERIQQLYEKLGYDFILLNAPRMINCTGDRTPALEVLATRNL